METACIVFKKDTEGIMTTTTSEKQTFNPFQADNTEILARLQFLSAQEQARGMNALSAAELNECQQLVNYVEMAVAPVGKCFKGMTLQAATVVFQCFTTLGFSQSTEGFGLQTVRDLTGMPDITLEPMKSKAAERYLSRQAER